MNIQDTSTQKLHELLKTMSLDEYGAYITDHNLQNMPSISAYFERYILEHGLTKKELVKNSFLDRTYGYQILSGLRKPSKDKILALCLSARMSFEEIQRALEIAQTGILYAKDPRDAAIILCIHNGMYNVNDINQFLVQEGFAMIK